MPQEKIIVGYDQDYPGSYRWPRYAILCPECGEWKEEYGTVDVLEDGEWHHLCEECGEKAWARVQEHERKQEEERS